MKETKSKPFPENLVGMTVGEATRFLAKMKLELRVTKINGVDKMVTEDYVIRRMNVGIEDNVITEVFRAG